MNTNLTELILNQAPEVYEQMTQWGVIDGWILVTVCTLVALSFIITAWWVSRKLKSDYDDPTPTIWTIAILCAFVALIGAASGITEIAKIKTAPKAWLVDRIISKTK